MNATETPYSEGILGRWLTAHTVQRGNAALLVFLALYFFIIPGVLYVHYLQDPNLAGPGIPDLAWRMHRDLSPRYEKWARDRVASGVAARVNPDDVPATEWPIFGSVFYLWATESLQKEWERDPSHSSAAPRDYARGAVDASTALIMDPNHHTWVREKWGPDYLYRENLFFRSLLIAGATSHENLTRSGQYLVVMREQATSLAKELDESPHGVLNDYPYECYPLDVLATMAIIQRAYRVLGLDAQPLITRSRRAFQGAMLDNLGLIPYSADPRRGLSEEPSRGTVNSWAGMFAWDLYPDLHAKWSETFEKHFWQEGLCTGWREFPRETPGKNWLSDVDAGPIMAGYSPAANAFGYAAARVNGRLDHAEILGAQVLAASWPLPDGRLLGARILSISPHAPYLGEAAILYFLTQTPAPGTPLRTGGHWPPLVWIMMAVYFGTGTAVVATSVTRLRRWRREQEVIVVPLEPVQAFVWLLLLATAAVLILLGHASSGMLAILLALLLPKTCRCRCGSTRRGVTLENLCRPGANESC